MSTQVKPPCAALVTGAASGIGASFAKVLAREGYDLLLVDRRAEPVTALARELGQRFGIKTDVIVQDLAERDAAIAIRERCDAVGWPVGVLVNNAGYHLNKLLHADAWSVIEDNLRVLVRVVLHTTHLFLPEMIARGWGRVINVASISGLMPGGRRLAAYASAKAVVVRFSEALNFELEGTGVHVTALCPGFTETGLFVTCGLTDVRDSVPSFMWLKPDRVAEEGLHAAMRKVPVYVSGAEYRFLLTVMKLLPRQLVRERTRILHKAAYGGALPPRTPGDPKERGRRRAALVTGASSGIGASFAEALARDGYDVILVARRRERLEALAAELTHRYDVRAHAFAQDLTDPVAPLAILAHCATLDSAVDVLVNNAGRPITKLFHRMAWSEADGTLQLLMTAPVHLTHLFLPRMLERGHGRIINVASFAGFEPGSYRSSLYSSCKAALISFSESVDAELAGTGVKVTAVCPGFTRTEWMTKNRLKNEQIPAFMWLSSDRVATDGLRASRNGSAIRVVGTTYRLLASLLEIAPRRALGRVLSAARKGMSM